ncbi:MAG: imidazoleglycerol-phosphate dehydratase [Thermoplasmata archaeon]
MTGRFLRLARQSAETRVELGLRLRGTGRLRWESPEPSVAHPLEALTRCAGWDLRIVSAGDDPHHRTEDVALTLGRAFRGALPERGIQRFASALVPMDETLVEVALDLIDRPYYRTDIPPTTLAEHFLRSFATEARITYHQRSVRPGEPHHLLEATFKATGIALADAVRPVRRPISTKGRVRWEGPR